MTFTRTIPTSFWWNRFNIEILSSPKIVFYEIRLKFELLVLAFSSSSKISNTTMFSSRFPIYATIKIFMFTTTSLIFWLIMTFKFSWSILKSFETIAICAFTLLRSFSTRTKTFSRIFTNVWRFKLSTFLRFETLMWWTLLSTVFSTLFTSKFAHPL